MADLECSSLDCDIIFQNNNFTSNSAQCGGAINYRTFRPTLINNIFFENEAVYGPDLSSFPIQLLLLNEPEYWAQSGLYFPDFVLALQDQDN